MSSGLEHLIRLHGDWQPLIRTRANVLVTGPRVMLEAFGAVCRDDFRQPVACASAAGPLKLDAAPTLVLTDMHLLDAVSQAELAGWMQRPANADTQIVSFSPVPLFPLVQSGAFDSTLFYRLNTIHLRLSDVDA
jgi:Sigma-54 interaction domain